MSASNQFHRFFHENICLKRWKSFQHATGVDILLHILIFNTPEIPNMCGKILKLWIRDVKNEGCLIPNISEMDGVQYELFKRLIDNLFTKIRMEDVLARHC